MVEMYIRKNVNRMFRSASVSISAIDAFVKYTVATAQPCVNVVGKLFTGEL